ncbi:MAG: S26 family signal peptidase [bacterium]
MDQYFTVASNSMQPVLKAGDKITAQPVDSSSLEIGQVIVFKDEFGKFIVHRIVRKNGFLLVTAGDSLRKFDAPIHIYDVVGTVKELEIKKPASKLFRLFRALMRKVI